MLNRKRQLESVDQQKCTDDIEFRRDIKIGIKASIEEYVNKPQSGLWPLKPLGSEDMGNGL